MEDFLRDLRMSVRQFAQAPAFTIAALTALALGIGANTAIFSVVNTVLLKPIPFPDPDRLIYFMMTSPQGSGAGASPTMFNTWRAQTAVVEDAAAYRFDVVNLTGGDDPEQVPSGQVSADFFRLFGAPIAAGRTFTAEEDLPTGGHVAVLSYGFWLRAPRRASAASGSAARDNDTTPDRTGTYSGETAGTLALTIRHVGRACPSRACDYHGADPSSLKHPPVGPSSGRSASLTGVAAPCSTVFVPLCWFMSVAV